MTWGKFTALVALNIQPALYEKKTGVGMVAQELSKRLNSMEPNVFLEAICNDPKTQERAQLRMGGSKEIWFCTAIKSRYYELLWRAFSVPHRWFFTKQASVRMFFNFYVPPGVQGTAVTLIHDMVLKAYPETMRTKTRVALAMSLRSSIRRAGYIFTISEFSKSEIVKYMKVKPEKIGVLPLGIDHKRYHTSYSGEQIAATLKKYGIDKPYFLYVGTLEPRKNIGAILDAYAQLRKRGGECPELVLSGGKGWKYESIFEKIEQLGLGDSIHVTGYLEEEEVPHLMGGAIAFLFPSLYEGFGLPPLEAMACGTPVIVSDRASLPEVVGDAGITVDALDGVALADAMLSLANDEQLRAEYAQKGIERAALFTWDRAAETLRDALVELLQEKV